MSTPKNIGEHRAWKIDEKEVRDLIERWAKAVRDKDYDGILANHSADILMFDVPPPRESKGIDAYRGTWDLFFSCQPEPIWFDIQRLPSS
jgi:ketosteroid isomerase-like protein